MWEWLAESTYPIARGNELLLWLIMFGVGVIVGWVIADLRRH
jgi:hypothetical protein